MHKYFLILISLFWYNSYADCAGGGITVWPLCETLNQNTVLIIEGCYENQEVILGMTALNKVYLRSGKKFIRLIVSEIHIGDFAITQAVLKPLRKPEIGLFYTIYVDFYGEIKRYNSERNEMEPISYYINYESDSDKPFVSSVPKEINKRFVLFGCGPSMFIDFDFPVSDKSQVIVRTTVRNLQSGIETTYYIEAVDSMISVGHGMCSGAFWLKENSEYEVQFSFMDSSGNLSECPNWIKFVSPQYVFVDEK